MRTDVVLIPVSVSPGPDPQPVALTGRDGWLRAKANTDPAGAAARLAEDLPREVRWVLDARGTRPEAVTFKQSTRHDGIDLIYTIPLPTPFADARLGGREWIPLAEPPTRWSEAKARGASVISDTEGAELMIEWWAERLEEDTALLAFLPRYFTARQARDVYSAFWGYEQDADGFATWSGLGKRTGAFSEYVEAADLSPGDLIEELLAAITEVEALDDADPLEQSRASLFAVRASEGLVGIDPAHDLGPAGDRLSLTSAAAHVAHQRRVRGPRPTWFRRADDQIKSKLKLPSLYTPRPTWMYAGS